MRKLFVAAVAVATLLSTGILTTRSDAMTAGTPAGVRAALATKTAVKHVRWSRHHRHHRHAWMRRHHHRHVR